MNMAKDNQAQVKFLLFETEKYMLQSILITILGKLNEIHR